VPYGVIDCEGACVRTLREKPEIKLFVNAGIYLLEPHVCGYVPENQHFNMTELIERLIEASRTVVSFPIREYWLDIGHTPTMHAAQTDLRNADGRRLAAVCRSLPTASPTRCLAGGLGSADGELRQRAGSDRGRGAGLGLRRLGRRRGSGRRK